MREKTLKMKKQTLVAIVFAALFLTPAVVGAVPEPTTGVLAAIGSTIIATILFFGSANKRSTAFRSL